MAIETFAAAPESTSRLAVAVAPGVPCVGVVMFVMLFGYPPFHAEADADIFRLILQGFEPVTKKGQRDRSRPQHQQ